MTTLAELKTHAALNFWEFESAQLVASAHPSLEARQAAYRALYHCDVSKGNVSVKAYSPVNRTGNRRKHMRFLIRVDGKRASENEAHDALQSIFVREGLTND